jgi:hypothetical protein
MLIIGANCISLDQEKTQMAIWSILAAPLIMGNDLRKVSESSRNILLNREAIRVNQDALGQMGIRLPSDSTDTQKWVRQMQNGDIAVVLYNRAMEGGADIMLNFNEDLNLKSGTVVTIKDIFQGENLGDFKDQFVAVSVPQNGVRFLRLTPKK